MDEIDKHINEIEECLVDLTVAARGALKRNRSMAGYIANKIATIQRRVSLIKEIRGES